MVVAPRMSTAEADFTLLPSTPQQGVVAGLKPRMPRNGMLTPGIGPSRTGYAVELLIIATAAAPCLAPKIARSTRAHEPRTVTTNLPVIFAGSYSASTQPEKVPCIGMTYVWRPLKGPELLRFEFSATSGPPG